MPRPRAATSRPVPCHPRTLLAAAVVAWVTLATGCGPADGTDRPKASEVMLRQRPFTAPGQIAQTLDEGDRALVFIEREGLAGRPEVAFDPAWTFEMTVTRPDGEAVALDPDPVVPLVWSRDDGVRLVGGFDAVARGNYQITISSPNCPAGTASMIVLPIN